MQMDKTFILSWLCRGQVIMPSIEVQFLSVRLVHIMAETNILNIYKKKSVTFKQSLPLERVPKGNVVKKVGH